MQPGQVDSDVEASPRPGAEGIEQVPDMLERISSMHKMGCRQIREAGASLSIKTIEQVTSGRTREGGMEEVVRTPALTR